MRSFTLLILLLAVVFLCCNSTVNQQQTLNKTMFTLDTYPVVSGSSSTHPLGVLIACKMLNIPYSWKTLSFMKAKRLMPEFTNNEKKKRQQFWQKTAHYGTHGSYVRLIQGKADLILTARLPSPDELNLAKKQNIKLLSKPIALDALVFIVNKKNKVDNLTIEQIKRAYIRKLTNWQKVGGSNNKIRAYQKNKNSASQELMKSLVMKNQPMLEYNPMILYGMMGPINRINDDQYGLGYSVYYFENFMSLSKKIKQLAVNGVQPNYANIQSQKYPFTTEVYAVVRSDLNKRSSAYKLRNWLLSKQGQMVVKESGYVPLQK